MKFKGFLILLIVTFSGSVFAQSEAKAGVDLVQSGDSILGDWTTKPGDNGFATVRIEKNNDKYFGSIVSLSQPNYPSDDEEGMGGKPKVDRRNPDISLRNRSIVGVQLLKDFVHKGDNKWKDGTIYDPENGKTYKCNITLKDDHTLKVRGYIGFSFIGRTTEWKRLSTN